MEINLKLCFYFEVKSLLNVSIWCAYCQFSLIAKDEQHAYDSQHLVTIVLTWGSYCQDPAHDTHTLVIFLSQTLQTFKNRQMDMGHNKSKFW